MWGMASLTCQQNPDLQKLKSRIMGMPTSIDAGETEAIIWVPLLSAFGTPSPPKL